MISPNDTYIKAAIKNLMNRQREIASKWDYHPDGSRRHLNVGEKLMLIVSELSEAMEGHRKDLMDDHLPQRKMIEVELADACLRIFDLAEDMQLDLGGAILEKMEYNKNRQDHTLDARKGPNGKKY